MKSAADSAMYLFDRFILDLRRGRLLADGSEVDLRPKSFQLLCYLLDNPGRLISKEELIGVGWPDVVVTDDALTKCIGDIRTALGDTAQSIVKTVPRRGYVLTAEVKRNTAAVAATASAMPSRKATRWWVGAAGALALLCVGFYLVLTPARPAPDRTASIAVLPLSNLSGDTAQEYFSDGLSEDLTTALSKFPGLLVIAPNSAFKYKTQRPEPKVIGQQLSVRYLLDGSVRRDTERLRVTARLVDASSGTQLWAEHYERPVAELFAIRNEMATRIAVSLVNQVSKAELQRNLEKPPQSMVAWDHYVRGTAVLRNFTAGDRGPLLVAARQHFRAALAVDARYGPAMQALAQTFTAAWLEPASVEPIKSEYQQAATLQQAQALCEQAIDIDPYLADAHATLAWVLHWQYQRSAGIASFRRALELNPNLAEGRFSLMLTHAGHAQQGVQEMQRIMRLDPHHPALYWTWLGNAYYLLGKDDLALEALRIAASRQPRHRPTHVWLAAAAAMAGQSAEAQRARDIVLQLQPDFTISRFVQLLRLTVAADTDRLAQGLRLARLPV